MYYMEHVSVVNVRRGYGGNNQTCSPEVSNMGGMQKNSRNTDERQNATKSMSLRGCNVVED